MNAAALAFGALVAFSSLAAPALAKDAASVKINTTCCDPPARWAERYDARDARLAITTEDGAAVLLLVDDAVAVQLSTRALRDIRQELRKEEDSDEDNAIAHAFKAAVLSGVRTMIAHSAECPTRALKDVEYRNGRLVFTARNGGRVFDDLDVNGSDVMAGFSDADARAFVREFRRLRAR